MFDILFEKCTTAVESEFIDFSLHHKLTTYGKIVKCLIGVF